jgi:hypothetical protein
MTRRKNVDGVLMDFTPEEEVYRDEREARAVTEQAEATAKFEQKVADKASGNQKLLDLGLSQAEVDALTK